jgi:DNA-binding NtrC family response regulator
MASARILYLDDEEPLVFIVKRMLERLGHQVAGFSNADAALAAFSAAPDTFHLVLTDMSMPGMNGIDFATAALGVKADARVVIVSGYMDPRDADRAKAAGVRDCIRKPGTLDEMRDMIAALLPPEKIVS